MIRQIIKKRTKIAVGFFNSYILRRGKNYSAADWWDNYFYTEGVSDRQTISRKKHPLSAKYHYASIEMLILRTLYNKSISLEKSIVMDLGSGSGHWIDFYRSLECSKIIGVDVSQSSVEFLQKRCSGNPAVEIRHGKASEILDSTIEGLDVVNAIGVMFHIVDDTEWLATIRSVYSKLRPGGHFIVSGHFGWLNNLNVQVDRKKQINKRLRSKKYWQNTLKGAGFSDVKILKNRAYLWLKDTLPENNILIAKK